MSCYNASTSFAVKKIIAAGEYFFGETYLCYFVMCRKFTPVVFLSPIVYCLTDYEQVPLITTPSVCADSVVSLRSARKPRSASEDRTRLRHSVVSRGLGWAETETGRRLYMRTLTVKA